jgi:hypothetical protein
MQAVTKKLSRTVIPRWKKVPSEGNDLRDQVRDRGCGTYFCGAPPGKIYIDKIAKAVADRVRQVLREISFLTPTKALRCITSPIRLL